MSAVLKGEEVCVRPMREADLEAVLAIERAAYGFPWSLGIFRDCLRAGYCCWVLEHAAELRAYGIMQVGSGESHILNICVHVRYRRLGFARLLLGHLLEVAAAHGADTALLEVRPTNAPALRLYETMGFNEVGVRRGYYPGHGGREDALILARTLSAPASAQGRAANKKNPA